MPSKSVHTRVSGRQSWYIFAGAVLCMVSAGTIYWFPALVQGLATNLSLSDAQITAVVGAVNSGSILGFIGGIVHRRAGSKMTPIIGATFCSLAYLGFALLIRYPSKIAFPIAVFLALVIVTSSYIIYGSSMATAAAAFPKSRRGRIMGLLAAMYGMSSGVCGVFQSAFFPRIQLTEHLLYFVAALCAAAILIAILLFPHSVTSTDAPRSALQMNEARSETTPLLPSRSRTHDSLSDVPRVDHVNGDSDSKVITIAFILAWSIVLDLQFCAYSSWRGPIVFALPQFLAPFTPRGQPNIVGQELSAFILTILLASFLLLPSFFSSSSTQAVHSTRTTVDHEPEPPPVPFVDVVKDFRYQLFFFAFFALPGACTTTTLVQINGVVASRMLPPILGVVDPRTITVDDIAGVVRVLVVTFSACNMMARLIAAAVADIGETPKAREKWKYDLIIADTVLMCLAIFGVAFSPLPALIVAVGCVGYAHGTFFAVSPSLISNWFGVDGFPMNFAVLGGGLTIAVLSVSSVLPTYMASKIIQASWADVATTAKGTDHERYCAGLLCYGVTLSFCAIIALILFSALVYKRRRVLASRS